MTTFPPLSPRARRRSAVAVGLTAMLALAACGEADDTGAADADEAAAGDTSTIVLYSANPQGLTEDMLEGFHAAHPEYEVSIVDGRSGDLVARLDAEWDNPQADVAYLASWAAAADFAEDGRLHSFTPEGVELREGFTGPDGLFHGRDASALGFVTNTEVVDDAPADWQDLTDERFADQVILPDPRESGTARDLVTAMVVDWGEDAAWEYFDQMFDNGLLVEGANGPALDAVLAGSRGVVMGGVDYLAYGAIEDGETVEITFPEGGTSVSPRPLFILEDAGNTEGAEALVDYMFSTEAQEMSIDNGLIPANSEVEIDPERATDLDAISTLEFDWDEISERSGDVMDAFTERYLN